MPSTADTRRETIEHLAQQLRRFEGGRKTAPSDSVPCSTCWRPLDRLFPEGGLRAGLLVEWLSADTGSGAATLLMLSAAQWLDRQGKLVVIDPRRAFYPPAAMRLGIDLQHLAVIQPVSESDTFWALEQSLRCRGVAATVCWLQQVGDRTFRRLQLAAEQGGGVGFLWRPARYRYQPSWADVRFHVCPMQGSSAGRRLRLERLRGREERGRRHVELELNDETGAVRLVTDLAPATIAARAAGA